MRIETRNYRLHAFRIRKHVWIEGISGCMGKTTRNLLIVGMALAGTFAVMQSIAKKWTEDEEINDNNPYWNTAIGATVLPDIHSGEEKDKQTFYVSIVKPTLDKLLSFGGLIILLPLYGVIALAIKIDDPGSAFFTQKRVGINKTYFMCHKFRSMRIDTPHDIPTHQLATPEQYMTRVGKVLRRTSLDELPQIWDIFRGQMSVIGPRPALWNQDDLVAERDKYGAGDVRPGLTGLAQINGRDELEIIEKARIDGEYVRILKQGGFKAFIQDVKCFVETVASVLKHDGVVEGGTGVLERAHHNINIDKATTPVRRKKILIVGKGSYIGESVENYLKEASDEYYVIEVIDAVGIVPTVDMFRGYDVVFNMAGIAHIKETNENRSLYYDVNRDMVVEVAKAAKKAEVGQFILISSMSVYGMNIGHITKNTIPFPNSAYGESKLSADEAVAKLADKTFKVAVLRPPMVYGKECKGNYQKLRKFALKSPIFPEYNNERSMIYIGNLSEFVKKVIDTEAFGLFFPQDAEYVNTTYMVKSIARLNHKKLMTVHLFNPIIKFVPINTVKKVFGNLTYDKTDLVGKYSFDEAMRLTELSNKSQ